MSQTDGRTDGWTDRFAKTSCSACISLPMRNKNSLCIKNCCQMKPTFLLWVTTASFIVASDLKLIEHSLFVLRRNTTEGLRERTEYVPQLWNWETGFPLFYWQKIQDFSRTFLHPIKNFPGPFWSPRMFKYKEKTAYTYNIQSVVHCRKFSMKQNVI